MHCEENEDSSGSQGKLPEKCHVCLGCQRGSEPSKHKSSACSGRSALSKPFHCRSGTRLQGHDRLFQSSSRQCILLVVEKFRQARGASILVRQCLAGPRQTVASSL